MANPIRQLKLKWRTVLIAASSAVIVEAGLSLVAGSASWALGFVCGAALATVSIWHIGYMLAKMVEKQKAGEHGGGLLLFHALAKFLWLGALVYISIGVLSAAAPAFMLGYLTVLFSAAIVAGVGSRDSKQVAFDG